VHRTGAENYLARPGRTQVGKESVAEPTNNAAERALRHAVMWRKTSYGTDSERGSRFVENMLSVVASCRQQGRRVLEYLTRCCEAFSRGAEAPSLLPQTAR
jgi:transposase